MCAAVGATYVGGVRAGLDSAAPERHRLYGIPVALSYDRYGLRGYVAYAAVARRFINDKPIDVIVGNDLPATTNTLEVSEGLFFVPADDKGDVTFSRLAFALFGYHLSALYRLYFVILLGSIAAYLLAFFKEHEKLLVGVAVSVSLLSLLSAFQNGLLMPAVVTFYDVRIFSVIAALALVHLGWLCLDRRKLSVLQGCCALYQVLVIVLTVHVRSSNMVVVVALFVWIAGVAIARAVARAPTLTIRGVALSMSGAVRVWPLVLIVVAFAGARAWERRTYHPQYFASHMAHHLVWHNVGLGFALHPELGKALDYVLSDESMMNLVARRLIEQGDHDRVRRIFGDAYTSVNDSSGRGKVAVGPFLHSSTSDLALYDEAARHVVLETARAHPWETAALFLYYKPRSVLAHMLWFTAVGTKDQPSVLPDGHQSPVYGAHVHTQSRAIYYSPFTGPAVAMFLVALLTRVAPRRSVLVTALAGTLLMLVASMLTLVAVYPAPPFMGDVMFWTAVALYLTIAVAWSSVPWSAIKDKVI